MVLHSSTSLSLEKPELPKDVNKTGERWKGKSTEQLSYLW